MDASAETQIASQFGVKTYPTIVFFINGQPIYYEGPTSKDYILEWI